MNMATMLRRHVPPHMTVFCNSVGLPVHPSELIDDGRVHRIGDVRYVLWGLPYPMGWACETSGPTREWLGTPWHMLAPIEQQILRQRREQAERDLHPVFLRAPSPPTTSNLATGPKTSLAIGERAQVGGSPPESNNHLHTNPRCDAAARKPKPALTPYEEQQLQASVEAVRRVLRDEGKSGLALGRSEGTRSEWGRRGLTLKQRDAAIEAMVNAGEVKLATHNGWKCAYLIPPPPAESGPIPSSPQS